MNFDFLSKIRTRLSNLFEKIAAPGMAVGASIYDATHPEPLPVTKNPTPPQENIPQEAPVPSPTVAPSATPTVTPTPSPEPTAAPGIENVMAYLQSQMPQSNGQTPQEYYPALGNEDFMQGINEADKLRQGLASLLLLQSFNESTLGRANNQGNYFGTLPGGEGSGRASSFSSPSDALNYQLGPEVLGGGANPNMNILGENTPLTPSRVTSLYDSYNPNSPYLEELLKVLFPQG